MAYFQSEKIKTIPIPIPSDPPYTPPTPPTPPSPESGSVPSIPRPGYHASGVLTLYKISDDNNVVSKTLSGGVNFSINFAGPVDVMNPTIPLQSTSDLSDYNYAYIDVLGRYYYISSIVTRPGYEYDINMHIDVLKTYDSEIRGLTGVISRQEHKYNLYLPDPEFKVYANTDKKTLKFSKTPFTKSPNFLLTVSGGA